MTAVVTSAGGVTLIGGGAVTSEDLTLALELAPTLVAADGGADAALALGKTPDAVIGDLDSISNDARKVIPVDRIHHVAEQDSTDFEKCLTRIDAPFVVAVGFAGRRLEHTLAALNVLVRTVRPPCFLLAAEDVAFVPPAQLSLDMPPGTRLSLFPMGRVNGKSQGLRWPIKGLEFAPAGRIGTSNETTGPVELSLNGPVILMVPRAYLGAAMEGCRISAP